jgi:transposase
MDKGFYSKKNVDGLCASKNKFLLAVPTNNKWLQSAIDEVSETIHGPDGYRKVDDEVLYVSTKLYPWGDKKHRCYLHLYYNAFAKAEAVDTFNEELLIYKQEVESGNLNSKHQEAYDKYLIIQTTPKRGIRVKYNTAVISQHIKQYAGFQALLTNSLKDPVTSLQVYRDKDVVEKCFDDLKNQLDMKRLRVHNASTMDGRLFIQFLALIYISALREEMRKVELIGKYTTRELLQEMGTLTKIKYSGKYGHILTELTKQQKEILAMLNITELSKA